jgi:hypothetical protein
VRGSPNRLVPAIFLTNDQGASKREASMRAAVIAILLSFAASSAHAASCSVEAKNKNLAGAAKTSFLTKCESDAKAKTSFTAKCVKDAVGG